MTELDQRALIRAHLEAGAVPAARQVARQCLLENSSLLNFRFLRQCLDKLPQEVEGLKPWRVALLSSFSIEFIHDALIAFGFVNGLRLTIYQPGFGLIHQEISDAQSGLYDFKSDITILAVEGEDGLPEVYNDTIKEEPENGCSDSVVKRFQQEISELLQTFRQHCSTPLLLHNLALPRLEHARMADSHSPDRQGKQIAGLNDALRDAATQVVDVHLLDYAALVSHFGGLNWYDERMRLYAKAPIANAMLGQLAQAYMRYFRALSGLTKKCLVLDLDNTLWGGVIGEEGIDGIQLGPNYPGNAFVAFQQTILALHRRGVILAVASKNNPEDIEEVWLKHRSMMLRKACFSAFEIHWHPKSDSLKRIAQRLNISLEHMVFVDDNPAECEQVRRELPQVTVIELPHQPERYRQALCAEGLFDTLTLSDEDRRRGQLYQQREQAETVRASQSNLEDYYRDLAMQLFFAGMDTTSRARAAQLTQKTNQFNLTTIRYSEAELAERMAAPDWLLMTLRVQDRFGDNGIVGVMMARVASGGLYIDTFLLSCRVIGRTVETAMLAALCQAAQARGLHQLWGYVVPTDKNRPVRDLFEKHGFSQQREEAGGITHWMLDLTTGSIEAPDWFMRS